MNKENKENKDLFCVECGTKEKIYPIINNVIVEVLCSKCLVQRECVDIIKESGRTTLEGHRIDKNFPHLTVKSLKESLEEVPDNTPVAYQRIEDEYFKTFGWKTHELAFDYGDRSSEYIISFSSYWHPDKDVFVINAHY